MPVARVTKPLNTAMLFQYFWEEKKTTTLREHRQH